MTPTVQMGRARPEGLNSDLPRVTQLVQCQPALDPSTVHTAVLPKVSIPEGIRDMKGNPQTPSQPMSLLYSHSTLRKASVSPCAGGEKPGEGMSRHRLTTDTLKLSPQKGTKFSAKVAPTTPTTKVFSVQLELIINILYSINECPTLAPWLNQL